MGEGGVLQQIAEAKERNQAELYLSFQELEILPDALFSLDQLTCLVITEVTNDLPRPGPS